MSSDKVDVNDKWLILLSEALGEGEDIRANHRYKYKGENLGTYLVGLKKKNNPLLILKIKEMGFDLEKTNRSPENAAEKFIEKLLRKPYIRKTTIQTEFNSSILPKKDLLSDETIQTINRLWKDRYGKERSWVKPLDTIDKILKWKDFRYDKKRNPKRKWFQGLTYMGDMYTWVYTMRKDEKKINSIIGVFNEKEKRELIEEGFPIK
tara:strand:- start:689 stop:1309 length:621 start_codon:yes stop_codon:yes gene_type:complete